MAQAVAPLQVAARSPTTTLKHLPAGHDELVFRGESAHRSWSVYVERGEIERAKVFQIALENTVALLPERSALKLAINGHLLATVPARFPNGLAVVPVAIPSGVLVPGFNSVDVSVTMAHRVDCSVAATYELWTRLDPAQTGFVIPAQRAGMHSIDDLASQPLAEDGTTHITLRAADLGDAATVGQAAHFIDALVERAGLTRPVVQADPAGGRGPGFDVLVSAASARDEAARNLSILGQEDGVTFARDPVNDRPVLILSGTDEADLDRQIAVFAAKGARDVPPSSAGQMTADGESRRSFASLGVPTQGFSGRRYASALDVVLPSDFYPANYDKAQLLIDGSYAPNLDSDSDLVFRVNGTLVSSLRLGPDRGGALRHEMVELPLRFFHPGHNEVAIEALTSTPADRQCDAATTANDIRFTLAGTSEITFPRFAHLGTVPQIPGAMAGSHDGGNMVDLYLPKADATSVGSGLTVLANMAVGRRDMDVPRVHIGPLGDDGTPGVVVGSFSTLPTALRTEVRAKMAVVVGSGPDARTADADERPAAATANGAMTASPPGVDPQALVTGAQRLLRNQGFFFGSDQRAQSVPVSARSLMVAAVASRQQDDGLASLNLPHFAASTAQWLVVTAADDATVGEGLTRLVSDGRWADLEGQAVSLDLKTGQLASVQPSRVLYVAPDHLVLSDLQPILGGLVSNHIELSLIVLMVLMATLGLSTHALIQRMGPK